MGSQSSAATPRRKFIEAARFSAEDSFHALTEEEMHRVAFPAAAITLQGDGWTAPVAKQHTFTSTDPRGKFTVRLLAMALAEFEGGPEAHRYGDHTFFEGLMPVGSNWAPCWSS